MATGSVVSVDASEMAVVVKLVLSAAAEVLIANPC